MMYRLMLVQLTENKNLTDNDILTFGENGKNGVAINPINRVFKSDKAAADWFFLSYPVSANKETYRLIVELVEE